MNKHMEMWTINTRDMQYQGFCREVGGGGTNLKKRQGGGDKPNIVVKYTADRTFYTTVSFLHGCTTKMK